MGVSEPICNRRCLRHLVLEGPLRGPDGTVSCDDGIGGVLFIEDDPFPGIMILERALHPPTDVLIY